MYAELFLTAWHTSWIGKRVFLRGAVSAFVEKRSNVRFLGDPGGHGGPRLDFFDEANLWGKPLERKWVKKKKKNIDI
jgi:hypothetical protein